MTPFERMDAVCIGLSDSFKDDPLSKYRHCLCSPCVRFCMCVSCLSTGRVAGDLHVWSVGCEGSKKMHEIKKKDDGKDQDGMERREDRKGEGGLVAFLLSWAAACFISTPASPPHSSSSSTSSSLAPQPQTVGLVTVLMAALYSLSPPHTPPPPSPARDGGLP